MEVETPVERKERIKKEGASRRAATERKVHDLKKKKPIKALKEKAQKVEKRLCRAISGMRRSVANPMIMDVPETVVGRIKELRPSLCGAV